MITAKRTKIETLDDIKARCRVCESDCWTWRLGMDRGVPMCRVGGKITSARRAGWLMTGRKLHDGIVIVLKCGTEGCVNPAHCKAVTRAAMLAAQAANQADRRIALSAAMKKLGRRRLTDLQAAQVITDPRPMHIIAAEYGISRQAIGAIKSGLTYPDIHRARGASVFSWRPA